MSAEPGMLVVWTNVAAGQEADFDAWYTREHVADRVSIPGFRTGARYEAVGAVGLPEAPATRGNPRFLALYETDSASVLASTVYLERLNHPTPWTQRVMPSFRDTIRVVCTVIAAAGQGTGGMQRTYRVEPVAGQHAAVRAALGDGLVQRLVDQTGVVRARVVQAVPPTATAQTAETAIRGADRSAAFTVLLDAQDGAALEAAGRVMSDSLQPLKSALQGPPAIGDYRLIFYVGR